MNFDNYGALLFSTRRSDVKSKVVKRTISFIRGLFTTLLLNFIVIGLILDTQAFVQFIAEMSADAMFNFGGGTAPPSVNLGLGDMHGFRILVMVIVLTFLTVIAVVRYKNFFRCRIDAYEHCLAGATISDKISAHLVGRRVENFCLINFVIPYNQITGVSYFDKSGINIHVSGNTYACIAGTGESRDRIYAIIMDKKNAKNGTAPRTPAPMHAPAPEPSKAVRVVAIIAAVLCLILIATMTAQQ